MFKLLIFLWSIMAFNLIEASGPGGGKGGPPQFVLDMLAADGVPKDVLDMVSRGETITQDVIDRLKDLGVPQSTINSIAKGGPPGAKKGKKTSTKTVVKSSGQESGEGSTKTVAKGSGQESGEGSTKTVAKGSGQGGPPQFVLDILAAQGVPKDILDKIAKGQQPSQRDLRRLKVLGVPQTTIDRIAKGGPPPEARGSAN